MTNIRRIVLDTKEKRLQAAIDRARRSLRLIARTNDPVGCEAGLALQAIAMLLGEDEP